MICFKILKYFNRSLQSFTGFVPLLSTSVSIYLHPNSSKSFTLFPFGNEIYISFFVSMLFGVVFTLSFTNYDILESLWVGLFSFLGADSLYKAFEDKIFASYLLLFTFIYYLHL